MVSVKSLFSKIAILCGLSLLCGTIANLFLPTRIPWIEDWSQYVEARALKEGIKTISTGTLREVLDKGNCIILDARLPFDYNAGHIPKAISLPYDSVKTEFAPVRILLTHEQPIITYCSGKDCDESISLTLFLRDQGFTNVVLYVGGFKEWTSESFPVEK